MRIALAIVLAGCCPVAIVGEDADPPPGADEAIELIHAEYMAAFDSPRREVEVTWVSHIEPRPDSDLDTVLGWSTSCVDIWVAVADGAAPSETHLAHEVAHCYAGHVPRSGCIGSYDNAHAEMWIWGEGQLVARVNAILADGGD